MDRNDVSRRRVLQMSGAAAAAGVGVTGTATATHGQCQDGSGLNGDDACDAYIEFKDQSIGASCLAPAGVCVEDDVDNDTACSVTVSEAYLPCGGYIDIHDPDQHTDTFKAGVGIGATCYLTPGTYTDVCIDLYERTGAFGKCVKQYWDSGQTCIESEQTLVAMLHLDTDGDTRFQHYCFHNSSSPSTGEDHAYLCGASPPPVKASATVTP